MRGFTVRFRLNGVWNSSDPFKTREGAERYAEHLRRRGGVMVDRITPVDTDGPFAEYD